MNKRCCLLWVRIKMRQVLDVKRFAYSVAVSAIFITVTPLLPIADCMAAPQTPAVESTERYSPATQALVEMVAENQTLKTLLEKTISKAAEINPDPQTNPTQNLKAYFDYVNWAERAMPWAILPGVEKNHPKLYNQIDQSLNYFYFVNDRPLDELKGKGLYIPSIQYVEPYRTWLIGFVRQYGEFLSSEESWNDQYLAQVKTDPRFGLESGDYEAPSHWKSFNDFFVRRLASKDKRPIAEPNDDSVVVFPGDSVTQGVWSIDEENQLYSLNETPVGQPDFVAIKSKKFSSVTQLMADSPYREAFVGGTMTHTFLDVYDYHRFHFPVSGTIKDVRIIEGDTALGGYITWDAPTKTYTLNASIPGWQMIETRALVVVETKDHGLVAILPIGMSQVSSVKLEDSVKVGMVVQKGDPLGYFLFGGSDIVMLFQKAVQFDLTVPQNNGRYAHRLMGEQYGKLTKRK